MSPTSLISVGILFAGMHFNNDLMVVNGCSMLVGEGLAGLIHIIEERRNK